MFIDNPDNKLTTTTDDGRKAKYSRNVIMLHLCFKSKVNFYAIQMLHKQAFYSEVLKIPQYQVYYTCTKTEESKT